MICKEHLKKQTNRRPTADVSVNGGAEIKNQTRMPTIQAIPVPLANALSQEKEIKEMERKNKTAIVCSQHEEFPDSTRIQQGQSKVNIQKSVVLLNTSNKYEIKITNRYQL